MKDPNKEQKSVPEITVKDTSSAAKTRALIDRMLRFLLLVTVVMGLNVAVNGILALECDGETMFVIAAFSLAVFYPLLKGLKGLLAGSITGVLGVIYLTNTLGISLPNLFFGGFCGIFNSILSLMDRLGYVTIPPIESSFITNQGIFLVISSASSLIIALSCSGRIRAFPFAVFASGCCVSYVLFDPAAQIRDFAILFAGIAALAVLSKSDKHREKGASRNSLAGFTAFILASLLLLSPISSVKTGMKDGMVIRDIIDMLFQEEESEGSEQGLSGGVPLPNTSRTVMPTRRIFTGEKILTVRSYDDSTRYLRAWVGGSFVNNTWSSTDLSVYTNVSEEVKGANFDSYQVTTGYVNALNTIASISKIGYKQDRIKIELNKKLRSLPVPSVSDRAILFLENGLKATDLSFGFDGITSSSKAFNGPYYCVAVYEQDRNSEAFQRYLKGYLDFLYGFIQNGSLPSDADPIADYYVRLIGEARYRRELVRLTAFTEFYKSIYLETPDDPYLDKAVQEIFDGYDIERYYSDTTLQSSSSGIRVNGKTYFKTTVTTANVQYIADIVLDYLTKKATYSLDPDRTDAKTITEELLFGGKEGYCVQFATVGTLIMRRLGFPTRYAEGYIADEFKLSDATTLMYQATVTDNKAHAWAEVWVEGFGFMTCEMTPSYTSSPPVGTTEDPEVTDPPTIETAPPISEEPPESTEEIPPSGTESTDTLPPVTKAPDTTDPPSVKPPEAKGTIKIPPAVIVGIAAIIAVLTAGYLLFDKARKNKGKIDNITDRAVRRDTLTEDERLTLGEELKERLFLALKAYKALPQNGELPESYGARLDRDLELNGLIIPFSRCIEALSRQVYSGIMTEDDLKISAIVLNALRANALKKLGPVKTVYYRIVGIL